MHDKSWTNEEVDLCAKDYLHMLTLELNGQKYNKESHIRGLAEKLKDRNRSSIQFKFCNVSAILLELGYPYIDGYKPRSNYQKLLFKEVEKNLQLNSSLQESVQSAVTRPAIVASVGGVSNLWVDAPEVAIRRKIDPNFSPMQRDYLAQEARNRSLGHAGESFVVELERRRLHVAGCGHLADQVEQVSSSQGDGVGYDVLSYETSGRERFIEVKTTAFGISTPFYVTRNEILRSEKDSERYHLYRIFSFRTNPRLFDLQGAISGNCSLDAVTYLARI